MRKLSTLKFTVHVQRRTLEKKHNDKNSFKTSEIFSIFDPENYDVQRVQPTPLPLSKIDQNHDPTLTSDVLNDQPLRNWQDLVKVS